MVVVKSGSNSSIDLVGSTLSDPYLSYSAALFALAGPLHGYDLWLKSLRVSNRF